MRRGWNEPTPPAMTTAPASKRVPAMVSMSKRPSSRLLQRGHFLTQVQRRVERRDLLQQQGQSWLSPKSNTVVAEPELRRALGPIQLIGLGIGIIIGAGIFVSTGTTAANFAGPGVVISYLIAGFWLRPGRPLLRRIFVHDPGGGQRLQLHLRHFRKIPCLADRLGPDPGISRRGLRRGGGLVRLFQRHDGRYGHPSARTSFQIAGGLECGPDVCDSAAP